MFLSIKSVIYIKSLTDNCSGLKSKIASSLKKSLKLKDFKLFLSVFLLCWKDNLTTLKNSFSLYLISICSFLLSLMTAETTFGDFFNQLE